MEYCATLSAQSLQPEGLVTFVGGVGVGVLVGGLHVVGFWWLVLMLCFVLSIYPSKLTRLKA
jgi:hypothetical protein